VILFLDFDGVTHPEPCDHNNAFCRLPLIESVLRERELRDVQIVISSSWREHHSLGDLRAFFSQDIQGRVIGVTPDIWDPARPQAFVREQECLKWLAANRPTSESWLAIDDRPAFFQPNCPNLFLTNTLQGFVPGQMASLREKLA
jgi:HAD domain in Swiss Army Knife RNA repair proteins